MTKTITLLRGLIGRLREMASLLIALGTIAMPLAVIVLLEAPETAPFYWCGVAFMIVGFVSVIFGWRHIAKEEQRRGKETQALFYILGAMAEKLGVDMPKAIKETEKIMGTRKVK